jgi:hypothetical protein
MWFHFLNKVNYSELIQKRKTPIRFHEIKKLKNKLKSYPKLVGHMNRIKKINKLLRYPINIRTTVV